MAVTEGYGGGKAVTMAEFCGYEPLTALRVLVALHPVFSAPRTLGAGRHDTRPTWAAKGEELTCPNGHVIATLARDVRGGDDPMPALGRWRDPEPTHGAPPPLSCCRCGEPWMRDGVAGQEWHIGGGWRGRAGPW